MIIVKRNERQFQYRNVTCIILYSSEFPFSVCVPVGSLANKELQLGVHMSQVLCPHSNGIFIHVLDLFYAVQGI